MKLWNWLRRKLFASGWRQPYYQFEIAIGIGDLEGKLRGAGFLDSPLSYYDSGEELNLRRIYSELDLNSPTRQIHVRAFPQGNAFEIRAHDEYTPEGSPLVHYRGYTFRDLSEAQKQYLKQILALSI